MHPDQIDALLLIRHSYPVSLPPDQAAPPQLRVHLHLRCI
jgi:hypothetical protein